MTSINLDYTDARARVLAALKEAAPNRVSTWDLIHMARHSRAPGRVWDLIQLGYRIEKTQEGRTFYWKYLGEPTPRTEPQPQSLFQEGRA